MENIAVTRGSWNVIVIWFQAWPFSNSSLTSKRQQSVWHGNRQQQHWLGGSWDTGCWNGQWWSKAEENMDFISIRPQTGTTWPVPVCYWPGHLSSLGKAVVTASVIYPALITLYWCFVTLINSVSLSQDWYECSVLEPKFFPISVYSYKHGVYIACGVYMAGEVSGFLWFPLGFCYSVHNIRCAVVQRTTLS